MLNGTLRCPNCGEPLITQIRRSDKVPRMVFGSVVATVGLLTLFIHSAEVALFDETGTMIRMASTDHYPFWVSVTLVFFGAAVAFGTAVINIMREASAALKVWKRNAK